MPGSTAFILQVSSSDAIRPHAAHPAVGGADQITQLMADKGTGTARVLVCHQRVPLLDHDGVGQVGLVRGVGDHAGDATRGGRGGQWTLGAPDVVAGADCAVHR